MQLPEKYLALLVGSLEPGEAYRRCMEELARDRLPADYRLTETIAHAVEIRYAIEVLARPQPPRLWNFGDLAGGADERLYGLIDPLERRRIAFAGSGAYPVTALLLRRRYPDAALTCIENHVAAYLLGRAVVEKLGAQIDCRLADAHDVDYGPFDAVVVAAMVGDKKRLAQKILSTSQARVLLRGRVELVHERLVQAESGFDDMGRADPAAGRR